MRDNFQILHSPDEDDAGGDSGSENDGTVTDDNPDADLPEKYQGKSKSEIAQMHQSAEALIGSRNEDAVLGKAVRDAGIDDVEFVLNNRQEFQAFKDSRRKGSAAVDSSMDAQVSSEDWLKEFAANPKKAIKSALSDELTRMQQEFEQKTQHLTRAQREHAVEAQWDRLRIDPEFRKHEPEFRKHLENLQLTPESMWNYYRKVQKAEAALKSAASARDQKRAKATLLNLDSTAEVDDNIKLPYPKIEAGDEEAYEKTLANARARLAAQSGLQ